MSEEEVKKGPEGMDMEVKVEVDVGVEVEAQGEDEEEEPTLPIPLTPYAQYQAAKLKLRQLIATNVLLENKLQKRQGELVGLSSDVHHLLRGYLSRREEKEVKTETSDPSAPASRSRPGSVEESGGGGSANKPFTVLHLPYPYFQIKEEKDDGGQPIKSEEAHPQPPLEVKIEPKEELSSHPPHPNISAPPPLHMRTDGERPPFHVSWETIAQFKMENGGQFQIPSSIANFPGSSPTRVVIKQEEGTEDYILSTPPINRGVIRLGQTMPSTSSLHPPPPRATIKREATGGTQPPLKTQKKEVTLLPKPPLQVKKEGSGQGSVHVQVKHELIGVGRVRITTPIPITRPLQNKPMMNPLQPRNPQIIRRPSPSTSLPLQARKKYVVQQSQGQGAIRSPPPLEMKIDPCETGTTPTITPALKQQPPRVPGPGPILTELNKEPIIPSISTSILLPLQPRRRFGQTPIRAPPPPLEMKRDPFETGTITTITTTSVTTISNQALQAVPTVTEINKEPIPSTLTSAPTSLPLQTKRKYIVQQTSQGQGPARVPPPPLEFKVEPVETGRNNPTITTATPTSSKQARGVVPGPILTKIKKEPISSTSPSTSSTPTFPPLLPKKTQPKPPPQLIIEVEEQPIKTEPE